MLGRREAARRRSSTAGGISRKRQTQEALETTRFLHDKYWLVTLAHGDFILCPGSDQQSPKSYDSTSMAVSKVHVAEVPEIVVGIAVVISDALGAIKEKVPPDEKRPVYSRALDDGKGHSTGRIPANSLAKPLPVQHETRQCKSAPRAMALLRSPARVGQDAVSVFTEPRALHLAQAGACRKSPAFPSNDLTAALSINQRPNRVFNCFEFTGVVQEPFGPSAPP